MQIFEFHFNPRAKSDLIFDSFCYEPANVYEKRLGGLYMLGFLKNTLPQNAGFLENLQKTVKERFYKTISSTAERSLKDSLKRANEFLEKITRDGDVSWLGNLSFAVISLKDFDLNFTKVGDLKIILLRHGQIIDIDQKLKFEDIEPYPLKIFGNIVSGKLAENDVILVLTKDIFESFVKEGILKKLAELSLSPSLVEDLRKFKNILNGKKEKLSEISGICLLALLTKEVSIKQKETLVQKKIFSFKKIFKPLISPLVNVFKLLKFSIKKPAFKITIPKIKFQLPKLQFQIKIKMPKLQLPKSKSQIKLPKLQLPKLQLQLSKLQSKIQLPKNKYKIQIKRFSFTRKTTLILSLILFLALGSLIFEKREERQLRNYQVLLGEIREKVSQAENFMLIKGAKQTEKKAALLLEEGWQQISPLVNIVSTFPSTFSNQLLSLKNSILEDLYEINKLTEIKEPELIFEFKPKDFIPQKIISLNETVFAFSSYSKNVFEVNENPAAGGNQNKVLSIGNKFSFAVSSDSFVLFFEKPDRLVILQDGKFLSPITIKPPYNGFNPYNLSSFQLNLYFSDKQNNKIIKYPYSGNSQWGEGQLWMENKKIGDFKSVTTDGSLWALTKNNMIERYYAGRLQETFELDIFPYPKSFSKIFTSSQLYYIYILEPSQNRIVVLNKSMEIVKQFQSDKFDNLLDFSVSKDGKTIYLLNGLKLLKVSF